MKTIFCGFDAREEYGYHTFCSSAIHHSKEALAFVPISGPQRDGTNAFTYARFLVPTLQKYRKFALFVDACDMVVRADLAELFELADPSYAVQVVKHIYSTKHARKYLGTTMEAWNNDYPRKNWSSVMLMNCEHPVWRDIPNLISLSGAELHQFRFLQDSDIGDLTEEWNWLPQEQGPNPKAKLIHYTVGIPAFPHYAHTEQADDWAKAALKVTHIVK